jgi:hypothetical protein
MSVHLTTDHVLISPPKGFWQGDNLIRGGNLDGIEFLAFGSIWLFEMSKCNGIFNIMRLTNHDDQDPDNGKNRRGWRWRGIYKTKKNKGQLRWGNSQGAK